MGGGVVFLVIIVIISCGVIYLLVKGYSMKRARDPSTYFNTSSSEANLKHNTDVTNDNFPMSANESYATSLSVSPNQAHGSINTDEQLYMYVSNNGEKNVSTQKNVSTNDIEVAANEAYAPLSPNQVYGSINTDEQLYSSIDGEKSDAYASTRDIEVTANESYAITVPLTPNNANGSFKEEEEEEEELYI